LFLLGTETGRVYMRGSLFQRGATAVTQTAALDGSATDLS